MSPKIGVVFSNLGTPAAPTAREIRKYLAEFLSDPKVIHLPRLLWLPILHGIILTLRPRKLKHAYQTIWTEAGSPLSVITQQQAEALQTKLGPNYRVEVGMRYGQPSLKTALLKLREAGVSEIALLSTYPQFSASTSGSTFEAVSREISSWHDMPSFRWPADYATHPLYINAIVQSIEAHWATHGRADVLLFSYHGLPQSYVRKGDPYQTQCKKTTALIVERLQLSASEYRLCFQSRFGRQPWLQPYTDKTLLALPKQGVKSVQIICPGFASDCLETLEEISEQNRDFFLEAGGEQFQYIPALNTQEAHIDCFASLVVA